METASSNIARVQNSRLVFEYLYKNRLSDIQKISEFTNLSYSTVLRIMRTGIANKEIKLFAKSESTGGRKAALYGLNENLKFALLIFIHNNVAYVHLKNVYNDDIISYTRMVQKDALIDNIVTIISENDIRIISYISIAMPCTVNNGIIQANIGGENLVGTNVVQIIKKKFDITAVIIENNMKAAGIACIDYLPKINSSTVSAVKCSESSFVAAIIIDGKVLHGKSGYSGEMFLMDNTDLDSINSAVRYILGIIATINPSHLIIYTDKQSLASRIKSSLMHSIPANALPEFIISDNFISDGLKGLSALIYKERLENFADIFGKGE